MNRKLLFVCSGLACLVIAIVAGRHFAQKTVRISHQQAASDAQQQRADDLHIKARRPMTTRPATEEDEAVEGFVVNGRNSALGRTLNSLLHAGMTMSECQNVLNTVRPRLEFGGDIGTSRDMREFYFTKSSPYSINHQGVDFFDLPSKAFVIKLWIVIRSIELPQIKLHDSLLLFMVNTIAVLNLPCNTTDALADLLYLHPDKTNSSS